MNVSIALSGNGHKDGFSPIFRLISSFEIHGAWSCDEGVWKERYALVNETDTTTGEER
jgi:hypothetical protein